MKAVKANVYVDENLISQLCIIVDLEGKSIEGTYNPDLNDSFALENMFTIVCGKINENNNLLLVFFKDAFNLFKKVTKYFEITESFDALFEPITYEFINGFEIKGFEIDINTGEVLSDVKFEFIEEYDDPLEIKRYIEHRVPRMCPYYQALFLKYSDQNSKAKKECFEEKLDYSQISKEATRFVHEVFHIPMEKTEDEEWDDEVFCIPMGKSDDDDDLPF